MHADGHFDAVLQAVPSPDYIVPVEIESYWHNFYVLKRPGVDEFLRRMGEVYEVVVFTASLSKVRLLSRRPLADTNIPLFSTQIQYLIDWILIAQLRTDCSERAVITTRETTLRCAVPSS